MPHTQPWREYNYRSADGRLDLFARDYPADAGGGAAPLLLMHGLTRNSADFEPLIELLGVGKRRMIVPDQRGRGRSQYDPDPANYRPDVYAADMWALLDVLGIEQVVCIGTSMGGLMAMVMGAQQPERIAGIVLNDVGPEVSEEGLDRIRSYVGPAEPMNNWEEAADRCAAINRSAMTGFTSDDWMAFARRTCRELPDGRVVFAYDPAISAGMARDDTTTVPPDLWALWEALSAIPILAIRGVNSDILTASTVSEMATRRGGDLAYVEVPDRGHAPILDEPIAVNAIRAFLSR
ncbi:alpha/beta fold hydrolase [Altererythrobacter sp. GH1-8]|uniref:alpha/beta fold hydrolase n=1 Tax=Altererythrobacter sp. GH1-8 TaxID=3349333 RepID=UPI00374D125C